MTNGLRLVTTVATTGVRFFSGAGARPTLTQIVPGVFNLMTDGGKVSKDDISIISGLFGATVVLHDDRRDRLNSEHIALSCDLRLPLSTTLVLNGALTGDGIGCLFQSKTVILPMSRCVLAPRTHLQGPELYLASILEESLPGVGRLYATGATDISSALLARAVDMASCVDDSSPAALMSAIKRNDFGGVVVTKPDVNEALLSVLAASAKHNNIEKLAEFLVCSDNLEAQAIGRVLQNAMIIRGVGTLTNVDKLLAEMRGGSLEDAERLTDSATEENAHHLASPRQGMR